MENSALNKAHQQERLANKHLRYRRYSEAIACHQNAVELLTEALKCTENPRSLESIKLQIDFHGRQKNIINIKREQHEQYKLAFENKFSNSEFGCDNDGNLLTDAIYQTIDETDSLIDLMQHQSLNNEGKSNAGDTVDGSDKESNCVLATKFPKDDKTVIEEFKILNKQLHLLVSQLVNQLDNCKKENEILKSRLQKYEFEKVQNNQNESNTLKVADSSGGTSPYVFSPISEFSPDVHERNSMPSLSIPNAKNSAQSFETCSSLTSLTSDANDS